MRPSSQLSAHTLHAFGSCRSSRASKHSPAPPGMEPYRSKFCVLQNSCRQKTVNEQVILMLIQRGELFRFGFQGKLDLAEAELESNSEQEQETSREPDVMIEYTQPGQHSNSQEVPIFSSITNYKSLPRHLLLQNVGDYHGLRHGGQHTSAILLTEPISPPRQFDSGLRVQQHSLGGGPRHGTRDETY